MKIKIVYYSKVKAKIVDFILKIRFIFLPPKKPSITPKSKPKPSLNRNSEQKNIPTGASHKLVTETENRSISCPKIFFTRTKYGHFFLLFPPSKNTTFPKFK